MKSFLYEWKFIALLLTGLSLSVLPSSVAQPQVQDPAYDIMLQNLLDFSVPTISVSEIENPNEYYFLDAREQEEFEVSHLPNARHIGYNNFDLNSIKDIPRDASIVIYCSVGYRSEKIGEKLERAGYENVKNLYGSIFEWVNQGKPLENEHGATKQVHAFDKMWGIWLKQGEKVF